jgi:polyhydroxybutyrate depolymerase
MKFAYALLALPLFGFSCSSAVVPKPHIDPGRYVKTIKVGDLQRSYILRVPKAYDNKTKLPLVFVFHGWTSSAEEAEVYTQFGAKSEKEGFILAVPNGTEGVGKLKGWNAGFLNLGQSSADDVKLTSELLDQLEKDMYIDESRVYVAGHSNGAMMAYTLGAKLSDRIAAIAVVSGTIGIPKQQVEEPKGPVSAIIIHGKKDPTVPYDDTVQALLKSTAAPVCAQWWAGKVGCISPTRTTQAGGNVVIDTFTGGRAGTEVKFVSIVNGGHMWPNELDLPGPAAKSKFPATDVIWEFFKSHPKAR